MAANLNQYQTKANTLQKKRDILEKEEAELDSKIAEYSAILKGQQMIVQSANDFLGKYCASVTSGKGISVDLQKALKNGEKETDAFIQCRFRSFLTSEGRLETTKNCSIGG